MIGIAVLIAVQGAAPAAAGFDPAAAVARHRVRSSAEPSCRQAAPADEIIVCGRRDADRFRVPLTVPTPGDPRTVDALGERERLIAYPQQSCGTEAFLKGCGKVGVTASTRRGLVLEGERSLAP